MASRPFYSRTRILPIIIIGILGFVISFVLSYLQYQQNNQIKQQFFVSTIDAYEQQRDKLFENIFHEMNSLSAFMSLYQQTFDHQKQIDAFETYLADRNLSVDVPGLFSVGLLDRVGLEEKVNYQKEMQQRYGEDFQLFDVGKSVPANKDTWVVAAKYPLSDEQILGMNLSSGEVTSQPIQRLIQGRGNQAIAGFDMSNVGKFYGIQTDQLVDAVVLFRTIPHAVEIEQMLYNIIPLNDYYEAVFSILPDNHASQRLIINFYQMDNEQCVLSLQKGAIAECENEYVVSQDELFYDIRLMPSNLYFTEYIPTPALWHELNLFNPLYIFVIGMAITLMVIMFGFSLIWQRNQLNEMVKIRTRDLEESRDLAEAAKASKDRYLALFDHGLHLPLEQLKVANGIMGLPSAQYEQLNALKDSQQAINKIYSVLDDIIELDRLTKGKHFIAQNNFSLNELMATLASILERPIEDAELYLATDMDHSKEWWVVGDDVYLLKVLMHLLENAVKHTSKGFVSFAIKISQQASNKLAVQFVVSDTGVGLDKHQLEAIRQASQALLEGQTYSILETGTSLALVIEFLNLLGSQLKVESSPGIGSTFSFSMTFAAAEKPNQPR